MSSALRELYLRSEHDDLSQTEEDIYWAFLKHTLPGLEDEFRDLYRRLHGQGSVQLAKYKCVNSREFTASQVASIF